MVFCNKGHKLVTNIRKSHNPYFNRWFSAILSRKYIDEGIKEVTILILIDGFLQFRKGYYLSRKYIESQSLF